jgi:hypothetical protein
MHFRQKMIVAAMAAIALGISPGLHAGNRPPAPDQAAARGAAPLPPRDTGGQGLMASCDPFQYPWVDAPINDDVPDDGDKFRADGGRTTGGRRLAAAAAPLMLGAPDAASLVIGRTPAEIDRNFIGVVTRNFESGGAAGRVARLSDHELSAIAEIVARGPGSERAGLLKVFATRMDAQSLLRVARAFGREPVTAAVNAYATPEVREDFDRMSVLDGGEEGGGGDSPYPSPSPPRPTIDMTLREIYLEYRTAPVGSLSPSASFAETAMFAGERLSKAGAAGAAIGTAIHYLIEEFAPELDDAIGGTIGAMLDNFWTASTQFEQGHYESAFDSLFGFPVTWSSYPSGDWDVSAPMLFYYQSASTCGW